MSTAIVTCTSQRALADTATSQVLALLQEHPSVDVIAASNDWAVRFKKQLAGLSVVGANVSTLPHWLEAQWELWGDGTKLIGAQQRHLLLRPVLAKLTGLHPSSKYLDQFASFVQDALALGGNVPKQDVADAPGSYCAKLQEAGLTEPYAVLPQIAAAQTGRAIVFAGADLSLARCERLVQLLDQSDAHLVCLKRQLPCLEPASGSAGEQDEQEEQGELASLRQRLFSGRGGLASSGCFTAVEVLGTHAEDAAIVRMVKDALTRCAVLQHIAVVFPSAAAIPASLPGAFAKEGIPARCEMSLTLQQTPFGAALLQLEHLLAQEDDGCTNSMAFACSPYSGLDDKTARAFAATWRSQAGSTHEARLKDLTGGISGKVGSKVWDDKLARLRPLMAQPNLAERVRLMFDNAKAAPAGSCDLTCDAACANAVLDYLDLCDELGQDAALEDIAALPVQLCISCGADTDQVHVIGATGIGGLDNVDYIVFARLDKDSYPMAAVPSPFDGILAAMGAKTQQDKALEQRVCLLDAIEAAGKGFACYRLTHSKEGEQTCQSALWDELMSAYRTDKDEDSAVHELPSALLEAGCGLRICEADVFCAAVADTAASFDVMRAQVAPEALDLLFPDYDNFNEAFSPTALEDYYRCPYRWFVCRRIGANALDKPFDQIAKGNLAHAVLERFYLDLAQEGIERVTPDNLAQCLVIANESFDWQLNHEVERHRLNLMSERDMQEAQVVRKQVLDMVRRDAIFLPGFVPKYLELRLEDDEGRPMTYAGVRVRGKVDRIDVDANGRAVVIDYKLSGLASGYGLSSTNNNGLANRIQTDIYALLVERCLKDQGQDVTVVGSVYRSYSKNMLRGVYEAGIDWGPLEVVRAKQDGLPGAASLQGYRDYLHEVEKTVAGLMDKMRAGCIDARPLCDDACEYCLAAGFCQERRGA